MPFSAKLVLNLAPCLYLGYLLPMPIQRNILLALRWYHPKIHRGVARYAREASWHLNAELARTQAACAHWDGDGIITQREDLGLAPSPIDTLLASLPQPRVWIGRNVRSQNERIGELAAEHFRDLGFRHVAMLDPFGGRFTQSPRLIAFEWLCCAIGTNTKTWRNTTPRVPRSMHPN